MVRQEAVARMLEDQAVVPVECDVPVGWSLDDYRNVRGLAREASVGSRHRRLRSLWRAARRGRY
jgi:hypothetical protein